ncbi:MAG: NAD(P)/FAD-dependent oxidoreductase [Bacteroidaceae bacterium]|nr:NAD(P)/FAD-dependent oxidoreductase [Bacteroidaceae bacterium]
MDFNSDLIIIGAGPGGYKAAVHAAKHGLKVTIFEDAHVGGTCLNVGCIPTKTYVHSATFAEAIERQQQVVEQLRGGVETLLSHPNITLIRERAAFADTHTILSKTGEAFTAEHIIIATGSSPKMLPIPGADSPRVVDSTGLLALKEQPKKLCIIGAGVIGMEFASVFHRFGSEVTVIEFLKECLPMVDSDIAKRLRKLLEKRGITFRMKTAVQDLNEIDADIILMATGRKANTEGLNLEAAGIALAPNGTIPVDEHFRTLSNSPLKGENSSQEVSPLRGDLEGSVFAIGDVNGKQMLAHAAEMQGIHVVNRILGKQDNIRFEVMPAAIFTNPEAACVGPTEDQLKEQGTPFECHKSFYRANGKALAMGETEGMVKLCTEPDEGRILSAHVFGAHAADIVQEVTAYITLGATLRQLRDTVHIHPTLSEVLIEVN